MRRESNKILFFEGVLDFNLVRRSFGIVFRIHTPPHVLNMNTFHINELALTGCEMV